MLSKRIFRTGIRPALEEELRRRDISIKQLAEKADIPVATLYKITSGERDPRFSTVRSIVNALEPGDQDVIALIAAKFLLDKVDSQLIAAKGKTLKVRGYPVNTVDDCIIAAVRAEKEGALGIICAPVLASLIERLVDIPVVIMKPEIETFIEAFETIARRVE
jgi:predicted transcriptional regulator